MNRVAVARRRAPLSWGIGRLLAGTALAVGLAGPVAADPPYRSVPGWDVRETTAIGHGCYAHAEFEGNTILRVGLKDQDGAYLLIGDPNWKSLKAGQSYPLEVYFGDESPWSGTANATTLNGSVVLLLSLSGEDARKLLLDEFMEESHVDVRYREASIAMLDLEGSLKAGETVRECQRVRVPAPRVADPFATTAADPFR